MLCALAIVVSLLGCRSLGEREEILHSLNSQRTLTAVQSRIPVGEDWSTLMANAQKYTSQQLTVEFALLEQRASLSYRKMCEVVPPKPLRTAWDKEVEASRLCYQAILLTAGS